MIAAAVAPVADDGASAEVDTKRSVTCEPSQDSRHPFVNQEACRVLYSRRIRREWFSIDRVEGEDATASKW